MHLVDVGADDPASFSILIRGWRVPNAGMTPSREGMRIGEHPVRLLVDDLVANHAAARESEWPLYHCMRSQLGHRYAYRRLILPLSADGTRTDRLLVVTDFAHRDRESGPRDRRGLSDRGFRLPDP